MLRNIAFTSSLLGLTAAAPQAYGGSQSYPSANKSPQKSPYHTPYGTPKNTPGGYGGSAYKPVATSVHHVTVTDHVTATDGGCAGPSGGSAPSSAAGASGSYVANSGALSSLASNLPLPSYTPAGPPTDVPAPPANTLVPATGPNHDANNLTHLAPATSNNLYYAHQDADTSLSHMFASLDMNFNKPAVVLENSAYISNVTCSTDGIGVTFNGDQGYNYAKQQWSSFGNDFILVSHTDGCKDTATSQRTFWQVSGADFDDNNKACDVKCSEVGIDKAASDMTAQWGNWNSGNGNSTGGAASPSQTGSEAPVAQITPPPSSDDLDARGLGDIWGDVTSAVGGGWNDATSAVGSVAGEVTSKVGSVVSDVTSAAVSAADKSFATSLTVDINASPTSTAGNAPWPSAAEIISINGIDTYCVGCGAKGHADVSGSAEISFLQAKIKSGQFSVKGNVDASMGLGLSAENGVSFSPFNKKIELVQIPLSPLEIPEILVIGPYINLDADVSVDMSAAGKLMMQIGANFPNFAATVDLLDKSKNSQSGFQPQWTKKFEADGEITVSTTLGLPLEVGFGLDVRALPSLNANVSVTNTASVTAYGNYSNEPGPCEDGVGWGIHFNDNVDLGVLGLYDDNLFSWQSPDVASGCIGGKKSDNSTTPSSTPKQTPGAPGSTPTGKHSGKPYSPTYSPATPADSATPTAKHSGKPYSPTYSGSPATGSPVSSSVQSSQGHHGSPTPGSPYQPPKASSSKSYPSAPSETTLATSKSEETGSKTSSAADTKTSSASSASSTTSSSSSSSSSTPTPTPTGKYNPPKNTDSN